MGYRDLILTKNPEGVTNKSLYIFGFMTALGFQQVVNVQDPRHFGSFPVMKSDSYDNTKLLLNPHFSFIGCIVTYIFRVPARGYIMNKDSVSHRLKLNTSICGITQRYI